jgi:CheY-like chemotaxis protein
VAPGHFALLAVRDTGTGMDAETQAHIFEPFFTTKEREKGTGLGLATVYGIVKQSGGFIWVYSEINKGTIFKIYLPRVEQKAATVQPAVELPALTGDETILLVEDSDSLRELFRSSLETLGYSVLEAANADHARQVAGSADGIDLLLTDLIMPGMSGRELADSLRQIRPDLKVLYMSGYAQETLKQPDVTGPGIHFLQKPFSTVELGRKIRQALSQSEARRPDRRGL